MLNVAKSSRLPEFTHTLSDTHLAWCFSSLVCKGDDVRRRVWWNFHISSLLESQGPKTPVHVLHCEKAHVAVVAQETSQSWSKQALDRPLGSPNKHVVAPPTCSEPRAGMQFLEQRLLHLQQQLAFIHGDSAVKPVCSVQSDKLLLELWFSIVSCLFACLCRFACLCLRVCMFAWMFVFVCVCVCVGQHIWCLCRSDIRFA